MFATKVSFKDKVECISLTNFIAFFSISLFPAIQLHCFFGRTPVAGVILFAFNRIRPTIPVCFQEGFSTTSPRQAEVLLLVRRRIFGMVCF